jgi:hypothetical protein
VAPRQERNLIDVPNPEDSVNHYAPKFDPEDPKGETLIVPVFFLYPEHTTSDVVSEFVEDTTFRAHHAPMSPPGESPRQPWDADGKYVDGGSLVTGRVSDDEAEDDRDRLAARSMSRRKEGGSQAYDDAKGQDEEGYGCMQRGHKEKD